MEASVGECEQRNAVISLVSKRLPLASLVRTDRRGQGWGQGSGRRGRGWADSRHALKMEPTDGCGV